MSKLRRRRLCRPQKSARWQFTRATIRLHHEKRMLFGGPFDGEIITVSKHCDRLLPFSIGNFNGSYIIQDYRLTWVPA